MGLINWDDDNPDEAMGYSIDSFELGKWHIAKSGQGTLAEAIAEGEYYWFSLGRVGKVNVWRNGRVVFARGKGNPHVKEGAE